MAEKLALIMTTTQDKPDAERLTERLLRERLAACVSTIGPVQSSYWWENKIEQSKEYILLIKTRREFVERVIDTISEHHPYDVPEIVAFESVASNPDYLEWLLSETTKHQDLS